MAKKSIQGSKDLSNKIKERRIELNLTIEEAAKKANVGTKTWCRYETGESIREDKYKGLCRALNWKALPIDDAEEHPYNLNSYTHDTYWSKYLENHFGKAAAASIAIGSEIINDYVNDDYNKLAHMPKGTHIGQIDDSWLSGIMPKQFLMRYDYDFMYQFCNVVDHIQEMASSGEKFIAHSVIEELTIYLMVQEAKELLEMDNPEMDTGWDDWIFDLFGDDDLIIYLYENHYLSEGDESHFNQWMKYQYYTD